MAHFQKTMAHFRSLSFPSASRPGLSHFDDNLSRLRSSEVACSSLSSMNGRINGLRSLYESIDDLLVMQQNISEKCVDDCISLLDACTSVKDLVSLVKQDLRQLLSAVRRKDVDVINSYMLKEAESVAFSLLESLLSYVLGTKMQEKSSRSLISKLMKSKKASDDENEFNKVDTFLQLRRMDLSAQT